MQNFQILIVSAVKICKRCLQTASTNQLRSQTSQKELRPWTLKSTENFCYPCPLGLGSRSSPNKKLLEPPLRASYNALRNK